MISIIGIVIGLVISGLAIIAGFAIGLITIRINSP